MYNYRDDSLAMLYVPGIAIGVHRVGGAAMRLLQTCKDNDRRGHTISKGQDLFGVDGNDGIELSIIADKWCGSLKANRRRTI